MEPFKTEQEYFWAGNFGDDYINRNKNNKLLASNLFLFSTILKRTNSVQSVIEFGSNIGLNLIAMSKLLPDLNLSAIEINKKAVSYLKQIGEIQIYNQSILDFKPDRKRDFVFTKGVLIHLNPEFLPLVYDLLYSTSQKYICIIEYYNPSPTTISYRGEESKLFKRDFAGELLDKFSDLNLIDYGFVYHRDNEFPMDDLTWFLLEKK